MDNEELELEILDRLAFKCRELSTKLKTEESNESRDAMLMEYLREANSVNYSIQDFNQGM